MDIDLTNDPIGANQSGGPIFLRDLWPTEKEIQETISRCVTRAEFTREYANVFEGSAEWKAIQTSTGEMYEWKDSSTYIQEPPFFTTMTMAPAPITSIRGARCLAKLGHSVTTDHISPAGAIKKDSPAGKYLIEKGVPVSLFNSYGARRGNDRVMTRGTFANTRIKNQLTPGIEGGITVDFMESRLGTAHLDPAAHAHQTTPVGNAQPAAFKPIFDAAMNYKTAGIPLIVLAGKDYGMGSCAIGPPKERCSSAFAQLLRRASKESTAPTSLGWVSSH